MSLITWIALDFYQLSSISRSMIYAGYIRKHMHVPRVYNYHFWQLLLPVLLQWKRNREHLKELKFAPAHQITRLQEKQNTPRVSLHPSVSVLLLTCEYGTLFYLLMLCSRFSGGNRRYLLQQGSLYIIYLSITDWIVIQEWISLAGLTYGMLCLFFFFAMDMLSYEPWESIQLENNQYK